MVDWVLLSAVDFFVEKFELTLVVAPALTDGDGDSTRLGLLLTPTLANIDSLGVGQVSSRKATSSLFQFLGSSIRPIPGLAI
jgi:hypothetical protein